MDGDDIARLRALRSYAVLDTPPEPNFDRLTRLAANIFEKPVCTLSLADADRHWFKSRFGVDATEMPRRMSFCNETIRSDNVFVVHDASSDGRFSQAPIVAGPPHLRFYAGAPLVTPAGTRIGSLCVLDTEPHADFSDRKAGILANLAATAVELLEARSRQIELAESTKAIAHLARHDPLTGLANRRFLVEAMEQEAARARPEDHVAVLFLDLDGFKEINDGHGHAIGDRLLQQVASRLRSNVGRSESLARLGGDEFVILHRASHDIGVTASALAGRMLTSISAPYMIGGRRIHVGVSVGIATGSSSKASLDQLLREADKALYQAKAEGRGRFLFARAGEARRSARPVLRQAASA